MSGSERQVGRCLWTAISVVTVCLGLAGGAQAQTADCRIDFQSIIHQPYWAFDQTPGSGWRPVGEIHGCELVAANLIAEWIAAKAGRIDEHHVKLIRRHEAILRALAGDTQRAIVLLVTTRDAQDPEQAAFTDATLAFLRHNRAALAAAREVYAALPTPAGYAVTAQWLQSLGSPGAWPPALPEIDNLLRCGDAPYYEARQGRC